MSRPSLTEKPPRRLLRRRRYIVAALLLVVLSTISWMIYFPISLERQRQGLCIVEGVARYEVVTHTGDTLLFPAAYYRLSDEVGDSLPPSPACASGAFVSSDGEVLTSARVLDFSPDSLSPDSLAALLRAEARRLARLQEVQDEAIKELEYYARTHSVTDDGYNDVMAYREQTLRRAARVDRGLRRVSAALSAGIASQRLKAEFRVKYIDEKERQCATYPALLLTRRDSLLLLRLSAGMLPAGAYRFATYLVSPSRRRATLLGHFPGHLRPDALPADSAGRLGGLMPEGGVAVNAFGQLCGICVDGRIRSAAAIRTLLYEQKGWFSRTYTMLERNLDRLFSGQRPVPDRSEPVAIPEPHNITGRISTGERIRTVENRAGTYFGQVAEGRPQGLGRMRYVGGEVYEGGWQAGARSGAGILTDRLGRKFRGTWCADTLVEGTMTDAAGRYTGAFSRSLLPEGNGSFLAADGSYYAGTWREGRRSGFGFAVGKRRMVRTGIWKEGRFLGEQMIYTAERVFGIDISRYQHDIGRRHYPIYWHRLRITHLGRAVGEKRRIRGRQEYPVSYVYVKATEGTSVTNRYYAADSRAARRRGIAVGAYHFFSTTSSGHLQARHFLRVAAPRRGDLPPVLDIEPTDGQIRRMGGAAAMWREVMAWIRRVEAHCGTRPLLYVSQEFVNKYMPEAPKPLADYPMWIARYSEYKPYVHLVYWQLSPDGAVDGIRGDVDINVYNGTREQFVRYWRENCVKR